VKLAEGKGARMPERRDPPKWGWVLLNARRIAGNSLWNSGKAPSSSFGLTYSNSIKCEGRICGRGAQQKRPWWEVPAEELKSADSSGGSGTGEVVGKELRLKGDKKAKKKNGGSDA